MREQIEQIRKEALEALSKTNLQKDLEELRVKYLGKKGALTAILKQMGSLSSEERPVIGQLANEARQSIEKKIAQTAQELKDRELALRLEKEKIDITLPGKQPPKGSYHPLSLTLEAMLDIFRSMGFDIIDGPEVETDYYNFEALNVPKDHPARDMQDTFYLGENLVLRTQTSGMQIHAMEARKPPIRVIAPGKTYRVDEDSTHSPMFHQIEGLVVDKGVDLCQLKGILEQFAREVYGPETQVRFRPSFFPFTEPSVEVDVSCFSCGGKGCRTCKGTGWIEILGAGMVHPHVLEQCGIDPNEYTGFAFGIGLERLTMTRHKITDIRLLFENDVRFLEQFDK